MSFLVPENLETERLSLRQFRDDDWRDLHEYYSDAVATKFTVGREFSEGESWHAMAGMIGHWQIRGYGPYAVEEKSSGKVLGPVGFWYPNDWPNPEIKWALARQYWGKGFAREAATAVQSAGRQFIPHISLISFIHSRNEVSINLALAIGAKFEREVQFRGDKWRIYRHPSERVQSDLSNPENRPFMIEGIDHINIVVNDLEGMIKFYRKCLGFQISKKVVISGDWIEGVVGLKGVEADVVYLELPEGPRIELIKYRSPVGLRAEATGIPNTAGIRHIAFQVTAIDALVVKLKKEDVLFFGKVYQVPVSQVKYAGGTRKRLVYFHDPEENILELCEYSG